MTTTGPSRLRLMGGATLLLVLVAGGLSGAAITRAVATREPAARERDECARFRQDSNRRRGHGPFDGLNLSAEQQQGMDAILEKRKTQLDEFWTEARPRMNGIIDGTRAELLEILTPEQRAENDRRNERRRAAWQELEQRCTEKLQKEQDGEAEGDSQPTQGSSQGRQPSRGSQPAQGDPDGSMTRPSALEVMRA